MKVALGQLDMAWEDKEASLEKAQAMVEAAAAGGAEMIVFPEMSLTGFSMNLYQIGEKADESWTVGQMAALAKQYHIAVGFGWSALPEGEGRKGTNRFTLLDESGNRLGEYCKLHPFRYGGEAEYYEGGDELVTVRFQGRRISLFICYDLRFPDIFQIASREADIFLVIANWPASRREQWITLLKARAIENQAYVVGVNCAGERDGLAYSGDSMAVDALGQMLGILSWQEGILFCEIDDRAWHLREKADRRKDRREDIYRKYQNTKINS